MPVRMAVSLAKVTLADGYCTARRRNAVTSRGVPRAVISPGSVNVRHV